MTTASAADRVHRCALELRDAEIAFWAAQEAWTAAYAAYCEAKALLGVPHLDVKPFDERSMAERLNDREAMRFDGDRGSGIVL